MNYQEMVSGFVNGIGGGGTLADNIKKLTEEHTEALSANVGTDMIGEMVDVAYVAISIVNQLGGDFEAEFRRKHEINVTKYDPRNYNIYRRRGYSHQETLGILKSNWQNVYDPR